MLCDYQAGLNLKAQQKSLVGACNELHEAPLHLSHL